MAEIVDIREQVGGIAAIAAHTGDAGGYNYSGSGGKPEEWKAILTTGDLFEVLGVPLAGILRSPSAEAEARPPRSQSPAPVILISLDGFRPDYLDRLPVPALRALAREGVRAAMRPAFPSLTFPNHHTIVTGLHPEQHRITGNEIVDPTGGGPSVSDTKAARSPSRSAGRPPSSIPWWID